MINYSQHNRHDHKNKRRDRNKHANDFKRASHENLCSFHVWCHPKMVSYRRFQRLQMSYLRVLWGILYLQQYFPVPSRPTQGTGLLSGQSQTPCLSLKTRLWWQGCGDPKKMAAFIVRLQQWRTFIGQNYFSSGLVRHKHWLMLFGRIVKQKLNLNLVTLQHYNIYHSPCNAEKLARYTVMAYSMCQCRLTLTWHLIKQILYYY